MEVTTDDKPTRVQRVKAAHDFLREAEIRMLLVYEYKNLIDDTTVRGPDDLQVRLENFTDVLTRMSEHEIKNLMAVVSEHMVIPWHDAIQQLSEDEKRGL